MRLLIVLVFLLSISTGAFTQSTYTYTGGAYNDAASWTSVPPTGEYPGESVVGETAIIPSGKNLQVSPATVTNKVHFTVAAGSSFDIDSGVPIGTFSISDTVTNNFGGTNVDTLQLETGTLSVNQNMVIGSGYATGSSTVNGNAELSVDTGVFTFRFGATVSADLSNSGTLNIESSIASSVLASTGILNIDSTDGSLTINPPITSSDTFITCINGISFSGNVNTDDLTISGNNGCQTSMKLTQMTSGFPILISGSTLRLTNPSGGSIGVPVTVSTTGDLDISNAEYSLSSTLTLTDSAGFGGNTARIDLSPGGVIDIQSTATLNIDLDTSGNSGTVNVNGGSTISIGGGGTIDTGSNSWDFAACNSVSINKNWDINAQVTQGNCPMTLSNTVNLEGVTFEVGDVLNIDGSFVSTTGSANILCSGGDINVDGTFTSGKSIQMQTCTLTNTDTTTISNPGSLTWSDSTLYQNSGTMTISNLDLTFNGGGINWSNGNLDVSDSSFTFNSGSSLIISKTGTTTFDADIIMTGATLTAKTTNFEDASINIASSTVNFNGGDINFQSSLSTLSITASTVTHSSGNLFFRNDATLSGTWTSSGSGDFYIINGNTATVSGGNFNIGTDFRLENGASLNINGGSFTSSHSSDIFGLLTVDNAVASFSNAEATNTIQVSNSGSLTLQWSGDDLDDVVINVDTSGAVILGNSRFRGEAYIDGGSFETIASQTGFECGGGSGAFASRNCLINLSNSATIQVNTNSDFTFNRGSISGSGTINIGSGATFIASHDMTFNNALRVTGNGILILDDNNVNIAQATSIILSGASSGFQVDTFPDIASGSSATISVTGGYVDFNVGGVTIDENINIEINDVNSFNHQGITFRSNAKLSIVSGTSMITDSSSHTMRGSSTLSVSGTTTHLIVEEEIDFYENSELLVSDNSKLSLTNGDSKIDFSGILFNVTSNSQVDLLEGEIQLESNSVTDFVDSTLVVDNGIMILEGDSYLYLKGSTTASHFDGASDGEIELKRDSTVEVVSPCSVTISKPLWNRRDGSKIVYAGSREFSGETVIYTGLGCDVYRSSLGENNTVTFKDNSIVNIIEVGCLIIIESEVTIENSLFEIRDSGYFELDGSSLDLTGTSSIAVQHEGQVFCHSFSSLSISAPVSFTNVHNASLPSNYTHLEISQSSMDVQDDVNINGDTIGRFYNSSSLTITTGTLAVSGSSILSFEDSDISIDSDLIIRANFDATQTMIDVAGSFTGESSATSIFTTSNFTSLSGGSISLIQSASFSFVEMSIITLGAGSSLNMIGSTDVLIDNSTLTIPGSIQLSGNAELSVQNSSEVIISGVGITLTATSDLVLQQSTIRLSNNSAVNLHGNSNFSVSNGNLLVESGLFYMDGSSSLDFFSNSLFEVDAGANLQLSDTAGVEFYNSIMRLGSGSIVNLQVDSHILISNTAQAVINGSISLSNSDTTFSSSTGSIFGDIELYDNSNFNIYSSSNVQLLQGSITVFNGSFVNINSFAELSLSGTTGTLITKDTSSIINSNGFLHIDASEYILEDFSEVYVSNSGEIRVQGGYMNMRDNSSMSITSGLIQVLELDLNVYDSSSIFLSGLSSILRIEGGDVLFMNTSSTTVTGNAEINVVEGNSICSNNATILLTSSSIFNILSSLGTSTFIDSCSFTGTSSSVFTSSGLTIFDDYSSFTLNGGSFIVEDNNSIIRGFAEGLITNSGTFTVNGNAILEDNADIEISSLSSFNIQSGILYQRNSTSVVVTISSELTVFGSVIQTDNTTMTITTGSDMLVSGSLASYNSYDSSIVNIVSSSSVDVESNGDINIYEFSTWNISSSSLSLNGGAGFVSQYDNSNVNFQSSNFDIDGSYVLHNNSKMTGTSSSYSLLSGSFIANNFVSVSIFDTIFTVNGNVNFRNNSTFSMDGTSEFNVILGDVVFDSDSQFNTQIFSIIDIAGSFSLYDRVCPIMNTVNFEVSGIVTLADQTCLTLIDSTLQILDGQLTTSTDHQLTIRRSTVNLNVGSVLFSGTTTSFVYFEDVTFSLLIGTFTVTDSNTFSTLNTTVDITQGQARFLLSSISTWTSSELNILVNSFTPGELSFLDNTYSTFSSSQVSVDGGNLFYGSQAEVHYFYSSVTLLSGYIEHSVVSDIYFTHTPLEVYFGTMYLINNSTTRMTDSSITMQSFGGDLTATDFACITLIRSPVSVLGGSIDFNENTCMVATDSPVTVQSGSVIFSDNALLHFTTPLSTLTVESGNFELQNNAEFSTVQGTSVNISGGNFFVSGGVSLQFDTVSMFVGGNVVFNHSSELYLLDSSIEIDGGSFETYMDSVIHVTTSDISILSGSFSTTDNTNLAFYSSNLLVEGNVSLDGSVLSSHTFFDSNIDVINGGNLYITNYVHAELSNTVANINGGSLIMSEFTQLTASDNSLVLLDGTGTLLIYNDTSIVITNNSTISVITDGVTAIFSDTSSLDIYEDSSFNVTGGNVQFTDSSTLNLWEGTNFNVLGGSFLVSDQSVMIAYPFTQGTIVGGDFFISDNALVIFIQSEIQIIGALNNNSTFPVQFLSNSTITINGAPVTISGNGTLFITESTFLRVIDGSIILRDTAKLLADGGRVLVEGGSILAYDYSCIIAENSADFTVTGGNVTTYDNASFFIRTNSILSVISDENSSGSVYILGESVMQVTDASQLFISGGDLEIANFTQFLAYSNALIRVIDGDLLIYDYVHFDSIFSTFEILDGGNFVAGGPEVIMNFDNSHTLIGGGDFILNMRSTLRAIDSSFEISNNGNWLLTDISRTYFSNTSMVIFGGGNLELFRSANIFLESFSSITIDDNGSVLANADSSLELTKDSMLNVINGGSIIFIDDALLLCLSNSETSVTGGGSLQFSDRSSTLVDNSSIFSVSDSGNIIFEHNTNVKVIEFSELIVTGGGSIIVSNAAELFASESILSVLGGDLLFSGTKTVNIENNSELIVNGGNIEYHDSKTINLQNSSLNILSGDFKTFDFTSFSMHQSTGSVSGGNFFLEDNSIIDMNEASFDISGGNVEILNQGYLIMKISSISVSAVSGISSGYFEIQDDTIVQLSLNSLISVTGGNFVTSGSSYSSVDDSSINITSGSLLSTTNSIMDVKETMISISGGSLSLSDSSFWKVNENSQVSISGGDVSLSISSSMIITSSLMSISDGNLNLNDFSELDATSSVVLVSGGIMQFQESSLLNLLSTDIFISCGKIINTDSSNFIISSSLIDINFDSCLTEESKKDISNIDLITLSGNSNFESSDSTINIINGNFVFKEQITSTIRDTSINIDGGNMNYFDNSNNKYFSSIINLSTGSLSIFDLSTIYLTNTDINISGGNFNFAGDIFELLSDSSIIISSGSASFSSGSTLIEDSILSINTDGAISFTGFANINIGQSVVSLSGLGTFEILGSSEVSFTSSNIEISGGSFITDENTVLHIISSSYSILAGETTFTGNSQIYIAESSFIVNGGNVQILEQSQFIFDENSIFEIYGNIEIGNSASLQLQNGACFSIYTGTVTYYNDANINIDNSCWNISGGNIILQDNVVYNINNNSNLTISEGSFFTENSVNIVVDLSTFSINGGDFNLNDQSTFTMQNNAIVDVISGNAIFSNSINVDIIESSFLVSGGYVEFSDSSIINILDSILTISAGDLIIKGSSEISFSNADISISGGGLRFDESTVVTIDSSIFSIFIGSVNFLGNSIISFSSSSIVISEGDLQFAEESSVDFIDSELTIGGQLEFIGNTNTHFFNSNINIISGNFHAKDHTNVFFEQCTLDISGSLHTQNDADIKIEDSLVNIDNGDFLVNDQGSFTMLRSSLVITSGSFIAYNPSITERKFISFVNSVISVESNTDKSTGQMEIKENVEISLLSSDVVIDGNLILTGNAKLNIFEESSFTIPTGVVEMDVTSDIVIEEGSSLLNKGQLVAPGSLRVPGDSSSSNEGLFEVLNDFNSNCFDDLTNGSPLVNSGTFRVGDSAVNSRIIESCIDNLQHSGLMQLGGSNVTFNQIHTTSSSTITLSGSSISVSTGDSFNSEGSIGGTGSFTGSFNNNENAVIMANGETGSTIINVDNDFSSSGTMFFIINSRDLSSPGSITQVNAGRDVSLDGGKACVCINIDLEEGDKFDLVNAQQALSGTYDTVEFDCVECPTRSAKSIEGTKSECEPNAEYGAANFAVLLESCDGGSGNYLDSISPPWYVIFPVAIGIILFIVVVFGGALFIEERYRKHKFESKVAKKRSARVKKIMKDTARSNTISSSDSYV